MNALEFQSLLDEPVIVEDLLEDLSPPRHFAKADFSNYVTDPAFPSQTIAVEKLKAFLIRRQNSNRGILSFFSRDRNSGTGLYLDGGFGVGKTHLLASSFWAFTGEKAFLSFQELMFLVGLAGLNKTADLLKSLELLIIDEFELDDPANTRISTNLLTQLFGHGASILTSSNTPPGALGEGKFSVEFFKRELGELFQSFETIRVEGEDYRVTRRESETRTSNWHVAPTGGITTEAANDRTELQIEFTELLKTLAGYHPIRIRKALRSLESVVLFNVRPIEDPHAAIRFVYFIDKAYDYDLAIRATSSVAISNIFSTAIFRGGDTKKYLRTISRLEEMTQ